MALSSDRNTPRRDGVQFEFPVAAGVKIYAGAVVVVDAGYAKPGATGTGLVVLGIAEAPVDNTVGDAGDVTVAVRRGVFRLENSAAGDAITRADIGKACYLVDDQTVAKTSDEGARSVAGVIADVDADGVWVDLTCETAAVAALQLAIDEAVANTTDGLAALNTAVGVPYTDPDSLSTRVTALENA